MIWILSVCFELKNGIAISVRQVFFFSFFQVMDQNSQDIVLIKINDLITACLAYLNFDAVFEFLGQFTIRCILIFKKVLINLRLDTKKCQFLATDINCIIVPLNAKQVGSD